MKSRGTLRCEQASSGRALLAKSGRHTRLRCARPQCASFSQQCGATIRLAFFALGSREHALGKSGRVVVALEMITHSPNERRDFAAQRLGSSS